MPLDLGLEKPWLLRVGKGSKSCNGHVEPRVVFMPVLVHLVEESESESRPAETCSD